MTSAIEQVDLNKSEFYSQHIKNWQQSGMGQEKYCESVKISYPAFVYWRMKSLGKSRKSASKKQPTFLPIKSSLPPIHVKTTTSITDNQKVMVITPNGTQLSFPLTISPTILGDYVKALRTPGTHSFVKVTLSCFSKYLIFAENINTWIK